MQNFEFDFSKTNFGSTGVHVVSSISRTSHNFSMGFFSIYTALKRKNSSFANKPCCALISLFLKTKFTFVVVTFLVSFFCIDCSQWVEPKIFQKVFSLLKIEPQINGHLLKISLHNTTNC